MQTRITWQCEISSCKGQLSTPLDYATCNTVLEERGEHCHPPSVASVEVAKVTGNMLQQAADTNDPPCRIIMDNIAAVLDEAAAVIGTGHNIKQTISSKHGAKRDDHPLPSQKCCRHRADTSNVCYDDGSKLHLVLVTCSGSLSSAQKMV